MKRRQTTVSEDARAAEALADPARIAQRMREYNESAELFPYNRRLDWATFVLAVLGAIVAICAGAFLILPGIVIGIGALVAFSFKFWGLS